MLSVVITGNALSNWSLANRESSQKLPRIIASFRGNALPLSCGHSPGVIYQTLSRLSGNSLSQHVLGTLGVWQRVFEVLSAGAEKEYAPIDSTIVQAHQHSAGAKKGIATKNVSVAPSVAPVEV